MSDIVIREAGPDDAGVILQLIRELAEFEDMADEVVATEEDLRRYGFGDNPVFECLLAESAGEAVGFALFYRDYSTFQGKPGIYLEDIYVRESARGTGVGRRLIARLARLALARGFTRMNLSVLHWNPAREVYHRLGFRHIDDWLPYRLAGADLQVLAARDKD